MAIVDTIKPGGEALSTAAIIGGLLIIGAFLLLSWSTYREMNEERKKQYALRFPTYKVCANAASRLESDDIIIDDEEEEEDIEVSSHRS